MFTSIKTAFSHITPIALGLFVACLILFTVFDFACAHSITLGMTAFTTVLHFMRPVLFIAAFVLINVIGNLFISREA